MKLEVNNGIEGMEETNAGLISQIQMMKDVFSYVCITCRNQNEVFLTSVVDTRTPLGKVNLSEVLPMCLQALME